MVLTKRMRHPVVDFGARLAGISAKSTALALVVTFVMALTGTARAHEMSPAIADVSIDATSAQVSIILQAEAIVAGVNLAEVTDTNDSPVVEDYDALRALPPAQFEERLRAAWDDFADGITLMAGETRVMLELEDIETAPAESDDLPRQTKVRFLSPLPPDNTPVTFEWSSEYGPIILRQIVEDLPEGEEPYSAFLNPGQTSADMPRDGSADRGALQSFVDYVWLGFTHIIPKGLDHILFVLGLFFFSRKLRPLLYQISAFTVAHTLTLALATLGIVSVPGAVVEPLIALSIAYIAVENILRPKLSQFRLVVVFGFGLLHGLGFASVLGEIGLSAGHFIASLIAFNVGVELGQLAVILIAYFAIAHWFGDKSWYRNVFVIPISTFIGVMGFWWAIERVIL